MKRKNFNQKLMVYIKNIIISLVLVIILLFFYLSHLFFIELDKQGESIDLSSRAKTDLNISDSFLIGITKFHVQKESDYGILCDGVYEIDFSDMSKANLFYTNKEYVSYRNPFLKDDQLYCIAIDKSTSENTHSMGGYRYVILKVENSETEEVMSTRKPIARFYIIDDHIIIYSYSDDDSNQDSKEYNIEIYDKKTGETNKIFNYHIHSTRREFLLTSNPLTLIVESPDHQIIQVNKEGKQKILVDDGRVPSWYEEGKSILYQKKDGSVMVCDIEDNVSIYLGKMDVSWTSKAMISPDKRFVAFSEEAKLRGLPGAYSLLKVATIDGNFEMNAPLLRNIGRGQVFWLKK